MIAALAFLDAGPERRLHLFPVLSMQQSPTAWWFFKCALMAAAVIIAGGFATV